MFTYRVCFFSSKTNNKPEVLDLNVNSIIDKLKTYTINTEDKAKNDLPLLFGGYFKGGIKSDNLEYRTLFIYDLDSYEDNFNVMVKDIEKYLKNYQYIYYTTYSHTFLKPKIRIILFPIGLIQPEFYDPLSRSIVLRIFSDSLSRAIDSSSYEATRRMYVPCIGKNDGLDRFTAKYNKGKLIDLNDYGYTYKAHENKKLIQNNINISDIEATYNHLPLPDVTTERVKEVLNKYESEIIGYPEWRDVVFALHHQYQGNKEGYDILLEWALRDKKRTKEGIIDGCNTHYYENTRTEDKIRPLTFATIIKRVNEIENVDIIDVNKNKLVLPIKNKKGKPTNDFENYDALFKYYNIECYYDVIKKKKEIIIHYSDYYKELKINIEEYDPDPDKYETKLEWMIFKCIKHKLGKDEKLLGNAIDLLCKSNIRNVVRDKMLSVNWDNTDRLEHFYSLLVVPPEWENIKKIILKKYLKQYICINCFNNDPRKGLKARQVLVFQGKEHIGKSTFIENLVPPDLGEGYYNDVSAEVDLKDRMNLKQLLDSSLVELGELDDILKSNKSGVIKQFISKTYDKIDLKFIKEHRETRRTTAFAGSVNRMKIFDPSDENTRFLTLPVSKIKYEEFDIMQIYAQLIVELKQEIFEYKIKYPRREISPIYELTEEERNLLKTLSIRFVEEDEGTEYVLSYINLDIVNPEYSKARRPIAIIERIKEIFASAKNTPNIRKQFKTALEKYGFKENKKGQYKVLIKGLEGPILDDKLNENTITKETIFESEQEDKQEENKVVESQIPEPIEVPITTVEYEVVDNKTRLLHFKNYFISDIVYGLDIETTGLKASNSKIALIQIYNPNLDKVFIYKVFDSPLTEEEKNLLSEINFVAHNASFERSFMPYLKNLNCSMIAYHAATSKRRCSIGDLSPYTGITYNNKKVMQTSNWAEELTKEQLEYAAKDAKATYLLWQKFRDVNKPVYDRMYTASFIIDAYAKKGLPVDIEALRNLRIEKENKRDELLKKLTDLGFGDVITYNNNIRTKKEVMDKVTPDVMKIVEEVRKTNSLINNIIKGVEENIVDGRLPINVLICGTETGRLSTINPNVQNFPRSGFRHIFKAREGHRFVRADFSGQELRMVAAMSNEKVLIEAFNSGKDPHAIMAARLNNMPLKTFLEQPIDWQKSERQKAKAANFGFLYGMGASRFIVNAKEAYNVDLTLVEAESIKTKFWATYSFLKKWSDKERAECKARGYALTRGGRKRYFEDIDNAYCEMINTAVQGSCGEVLLETLIALPDYLKNYLVNTVHDELIFEVPIGLIEDEAKYTELKNHIIGAMIMGVSKVEKKYPTLNITEIKDTERL
jgi:DNA polymerase-1